MIVLNQCINPDAIKTKASYLLHWLNSSREATKIVSRAEARFEILKTIIKWHGKKDLE